MLGLVPGRWVRPAVLHDRDPSAAAIRLSRIICQPSPCLVPYRTLRLVDQRLSLIPLLARCRTADSDSLTRGSSR